MEELTVIEAGSVIGKESKRFIVTNKKVRVAEIPEYSISCINILGNNQITTQAIDLALSNGIDINFLSKNGKFKGKISSFQSRNIYLHIKQYGYYQNEVYKLELSKIIVKNKIQNQFKLLKYYHQEANELIKYLEKVDTCNDIDEMMGYEGIASRLYFEGIAKVVSKEFKFQGRSRRPPKDEVNALLSLTYQMMLGRVTAQLEVKGLDTALGMLHSIKYGRESLGLDIIEEFRQGFCDQFVLKILKRGQFKKSDFIVNEDGGYYLNDKSLKLYFKIFNEEYKGIENQVKEQAKLIRDSIEEGSTYKPYTFSKRR